MGTVRSLRVTARTEVDPQEEEAVGTEAVGIEVRVPDVAGPDLKARRNLSERHLR